MNKNENNIETKNARKLTDEEAEQVAGGQNFTAIIQNVNRRSEIGFSFKKVDDPGSVGEEEN